MLIPCTEIKHGGDFWFGRESKISADSAKLTWPSKNEKNQDMHQCTAGAKSNET